MGLPHIENVQLEGPELPELPTLQTNSDTPFLVGVVASAMLCGATGVVDSLFL